MRPRPGAVHSGREAALGCLTAGPSFSRFRRRDLLPGLGVGGVKKSLQIPAQSSILAPVILSVARISCTQSSFFRTFVLPSGRRQHSKHREPSSQNISTDTVMKFKHENTPFGFYQRDEKALSMSCHPQWMPLKLLELQREGCPHLHLINRLNTISISPPNFHLLA